MRRNEVTDDAEGTTTSAILSILIEIHTDAHAKNTSWRGKREGKKDAERMKQEEYLASFHLLWATLFRRDNYTASSRGLFRNIYRVAFSI